MKNFVEPYLRLNSFKTIQDNPFLKTKSLSIFNDNPAPINGQIEVFHYFPKSKTKVTATFEPSSKKMIYNGELFKSPSSAAIRAVKVMNGKNTNINGWRFWKYIDTKGNEKTIESLK